MRVGAEILSDTQVGIDSRYHSYNEAWTWNCQASVVSGEQVARQSLVARAWLSRLQIVGILAFVQSLICLAIWLWVCANAGAGTPPKAGFNPELRQSRYDPVKQRDPFVRAGVSLTGTKATASATAFAFHLDGILYEAKNPAAVVNGTLLTVHKTTTLKAGNTEIEVKAVEITRSRVVLDAGGQRVELQ